MSPIFKKGTLERENDRPTSVFSQVLKVFESFLFHKQADEFLKDNLFSLLAGFRKKVTFTLFS